MRVGGMRAVSAGGVAVDRGQRTTVTRRFNVFNVYALGVTCLTVLTGLLAISTLAAHPGELGGSFGTFLFFVALSMASSSLRVAWTRSTEWVMGAAGHMVLILLLPTAQAIFAVLIAKLGSEIWQLRRRKERAGRAWQRFLINLSGTILAVAAGSTVFTALHGQTLLWSHTLAAWLAFPVLGATAVAYHETNVLVIVGAITLTSRETPLSVFARVTWGTFLPELAIMLAGILFAAFWHYNPILSLLTAGPLFLSLRAFQVLQRLREGTARAVTQMAKIIEYRDTGTHEHSENLVRLSGRLAQRAGLTPEHVDDIMLAAGVHDLGKIGIGNDILLKRGRLTPEEQSVMREHPIIGETILSSYSDSPFEDCLKIVRHHHERWDGSGYPDGLRGEEIPIGARIITVVDSFDAMVSDRPYRQGMPVEEAVERLMADMGKQFDPRLTRLFVDMLIEDGVYSPMRRRIPELRAARVRHG